MGIVFHKLDQAYSLPASLIPLHCQCSDAETLPQHPVRPIGERVIGPD
jgi:hypothetical protein